MAINNLETEPQESPRAAHTRRQAEIERAAKAEWAKAFEPSPAALAQDMYARITQETNRRFDHLPADQRKAASEAAVDTEDRARRSLGPREREATHAMGLSYSGYLAGKR